ncbi:MAG: hypothetical protein PVJ52_02650 [Candidatus Woesebacteria bacterium]|jgi:hypothetical protein
MTIQSALTASWNQVATSVLSGLPAIFGAIITFIVGLLIAFWAKRLVVEGLRILKLDKLSETTGVEKYLKKADIKLDLVDLLGTLTEWIIILVFFLAVVDILGLSVVSQVVATVLGYIPNVFAAALIFAAGYIVARVADGLVRGALASIDHDLAKPVGKLAHWVIMVVAFFAAVDQLQIARGLITTFFQGLTYTIVLVVGLAVGLGSKDLVSKVLDEWYRKIKR